MGHLERAREIAPDNRAVAYNLARTYKKLAPRAENEDELLTAARELLEPLLENPPDPASMLAYGILLEEDSDHKAALEAFELVVSLGMDFVPATQFRVAEFKRAQAMVRLRLPGGREALDLLNKKYPDRSRASQLALEGGRYTRFLPLGGELASQPGARTLDWRRVTTPSQLPKAGAPLFFIAPDLDGDCRRDIVMNAEGGLRVLRTRRSGSFDDQTVTAGLPADFVLAAAAAGDINNDGLCDLVVGGPAGIRVFLNITDEEERTKWRFNDYTLDKDAKPRLGAGGGEPCTSLVLWDLDHDGDLDIFAGGARNRVYRTAVEEPPDGGRFIRFDDIAQKLGMEGPAALDALMIDVDDDQDVDLLVTGAAGNAWFENLRALTFLKHELPAGGSLGAADVDNDLLEEVRIGDTVYKWRGKWERLFERPALLDMDGDGVIDADPFAGLELPGRLLRAVATDLNSDGSRDLLVLTDVGLDSFMSRADAPAAWLDVMARGLKTNEFGIGARVRLFAGDMRIGATCRDGLVSFGLGRRMVVDALMLRWSNGVEQGVVLPPPTSCLLVEEREGEVGSCPFLYTWDGERWHFIADCHSGTPLGLPYMDGKYLPPRSNETIMIPGDRLAVVDGRLRIDLVEEFRELFYVDQVVLRAVDHPRDVRPVLDEGFRMRPRAFAVHGFRDLRPPRSARDHKGRDILDKVRARDLRHAVVWDTLDSRYVGLAREWSITLDFGDLSGEDAAWLVMDGWVEFPTASASIAASQSQTVHFKMPVVETIGADGKWRMADPDAGFPAGKCKSVLVDLTGKFPTADGRVRVTSTQRLHWDAFFVSTETRTSEGLVRLTALPILTADHGFRGVGKRVVDPTGELPWRYSHDDLETFYRWDQMPAGMLTRYGDVRVLLAEIEDRYAVLASGDRILLEFDASGLPDLPDGWVRDYCFTTEGWVKDADMNQAVRESVRPLPFHDMSGYPYDEAEESHPHPEWVREWFTRPARRLVNPETLTTGTGFNDRHAETSDRSPARSDGAAPGR